MLRRRAACGARPRKLADATRCRLRPLRHPAQTHAELALVSRHRAIHIRSALSRRRRRPIQQRRHRRPIQQRRHRHLQRKGGEEEGASRALAGPVTGSTWRRKGRKTRGKEGPGEEKNFSNVILCMSLI